MNFMTKHLNIYYEYRQLFIDLKYQEDKNRLITWFPTNTFLFEMTKQQITNYRVKNFATEYIDVLKTCVPVTVMYYRDEVKTETEDGSFRTNPTILYHPVYWDPNCWILINNRRVQFNVDRGLNCTRVTFTNSYGQSYHILIEIRQNTLKEHILTCLREVEAKMSKVEINATTLAKTKEKYKLIMI